MVDLLGNILHDSCKTNICITLCCTKYVGMYDENKWALVMLWIPLYRTCGSKNKFSDNDICKFFIKFENAFVVPFQTGYIVDAVGLSGILKGKQKLGVTFNSDKQEVIDFT